jgi:hypothetical protein
MRTLFAALLVGAVAILTACGGDDAGDCDPEAVEALIQDGAVGSALAVMRDEPNTALGDIPALLERLDDAEEALDDEDWPDCADDLKDEYAAWMEVADEALTARSLGNDAQATELFDAAQVAYVTANRMLTDLAAE